MGGNEQRNALLQLIKRERLEGIVYNLDDDNAYHPFLWDEIRRLRPMRVGIFAVRRSIYPPPPCDGILPTLPHAHFTTRQHLIERPTYDDQGRFDGFEAGWCDPKGWLWARHGPRTFCVDMAGFVFDASLLQHVPEPLWNYTGHGGESELIGKLLPGGVPEDLQPLANCGRDLLVFHNEYRTVPRAVWRLPTRCGLDGWGLADDRLRRTQPRRPWPSTLRPEPERRRRRGDAAAGTGEGAWRQGAAGG